MARARLLRGLRPMRHVQPSLDGAGVSGRLSARNLAIGMSCV